MVSPVRLRSVKCSLNASRWRTGLVWCASTKPARHRLQCKRGNTEPDSRTRGCETHIPEQAGFRPGKSCTSHAATEPDGAHRRWLREAPDHRCCLRGLVCCLRHGQPPTPPQQGARDDWRRTPDRPDMHHVGKQTLLRGAEREEEPLATTTKRITTGKWHQCCSIFTPTTSPVYADSRSFIYADDLYIASQGNDFNDTEASLTSALSIRITYYDTNQLRANPSKTQVCAFHLRNRELNVVWNGARLSNTTTPVYLGVHLDRTLCYKTHIEKTKMKVNARNNIIRKLVNSRWGARHRYSDPAVSPSATQLPNTPALCGQGGSPQLRASWTRPYTTAAESSRAASNQRTWRVYTYWPVSPLLTSGGLLPSAWNVHDKRQTPDTNCSIADQLLSNWSRAAAECGSGNTAWQTCQPPSTWDWRWPNLCRLDLERTGSVGDRTWVGRAKTVMRRWGYLDDAQSVDCDCGEPQTMAHLLSCRLLDEACTMMTWPQWQSGQRHAPIHPTFWLYLAILFLISSSCVLCSFTVLPRYLKDCTCFRVWSPILMFRVWCDRPIITTSVFTRFNFRLHLLKAACHTFIISKSPSDSAVCAISSALCQCIVGTMLPCLTPVIVSHHSPSPAPIRTLLWHVPYVLIIALFSYDGVSYSSIAFHSFLIGIFLFGNYAAKVLFLNDVAKPSLQYWLIYLESIIEQWYSSVIFALQEVSFILVDWAYYWSSTFLWDLSRFITGVENHFLLCISHLVNSQSPLPYSF